MFAPVSTSFVMLQLQPEAQDFFVRAYPIRCNNNVGPCYKRTGRYA